MKRKIISFLVSISIAMSLFPVVTFALTSGTCGDNLTWTFDDNGVLTISGIGEAGSLDGFDNDESVSKIVVNEGVRSISLWGLTNNLKEIEIFSSDFERLYGIMGRIESLEKITVTPSNKYMCTVDGVLYNKAITEIILYPYGLENKEYVVPETIKEVSVDNAYLEEIVFHDEVTGISLVCPNLKELKIPDSVTYLSVENFLKFALYDDGLYYIGTINNPYKFLVGYDENIREVENAREIKISSRTEIISCDLYLPKLKELIVPDNVRVVLSLASNCENLEKITLGKGVEEILSICGGYMPKLKEIEVYGNIKKLNGSAIHIYGGMGDVEDSEIGSGAVSLYPPIYDNLKPLDNDNDAESFYYLGNKTNPHGTLFVMQNGGREYEKENLLLPGGLKTISIVNNRYEEDNQTKYSDSFFPNIKTIQIPESLTYISEGAFYGSENLTDVYYAGSKSKWEEIEICEGNEDLLNANIHFGKKDVQDVTVANIPAKTYGDSDFALDVTDNSTALGALTYESTNTDVATVSADGTVTVKAAGTTNITVSRAGNEQYADFTVTKELTVSKKPITVTARSYTIRQNAAVPVLEYDITSGSLVSGDEITGALIVNADGTSLGDFEIKQGTLTAGANYDLTFVKGTLTVVDKTPQAIAFDEIDERTYGDASFVVTVTPDSTAQLDEFTFESSDTDVAEVAADGTVTIKAAGETDITVKQAGNDEYAAFEKTQKLIVNKKDITVDSVDLENKTGVLGGVLDADTAVTLDFDKLNVEVVGTEDETTNVKITNFILTGEKAENYTVTTTEVTEVIANENIVEVTIVAENGTVTGAGTHVKGYSVTVSATPDSGYKFSGWYVNGVSVSTSTTYTFVAEESIDLVAKFSKKASGGGITKYTVMFDSNGGSNVSKQSVARNTRIGEPAEPTRAGYTFAGWYTDEKLTNVYDFSSNVTGNMTLYAKWTENAPVAPEATESPVATDAPEATENPIAEKTEFNDVKESDWYSDSVNFVVENKLMNGVSETEFAPNATLTRAMLVTVLYRNEGEPEIKASNAFEDIANGAYYEKAVAWAQANGIVEGITDTEFAPDTEITREQIATIMHRYAKYKKYDVSVNADIEVRDDYAEISEYAVDAMKYMVGCGFMNGKTDNTLDPKDDATRAEIATVLQRFILATN